MGITQVNAKGQRSSGRKKAGSKKKTAKKKAAKKTTKKAAAKTAATGKGVKDYPMPTQAGWNKINRIRADIQTATEKLQVAKDEKKDAKAKLDDMPANAENKHHREKLALELFELGKRILSIKESIEAMVWRLDTAIREGNQDELFQ